ncbi:hypothetical protein FQN57_007085 [Myotisia sp. PD_48]|nr:hypothetical protein FQN57_007085 [Myotisia sp. PD_48]
MTTKSGSDLPSNRSGSGVSAIEGDSPHAIDHRTWQHENEEQNTMPLPSSLSPHQTSAQSFTPRSLLVGLGIGILITFSNTYFGLQTGWISSMAMPSSLIGFAVFKSVSRHLSFPFSPVENVLIQTVAGAVGTMPLGCGFVGVIPAMEYLIREGPDGERGDGGMGEGGPLKLSFWKLVVWSLGVCLFGVVFAVPLRKEVIIREKLKFPSGTATALMIQVLHTGSGTDEKAPIAGRLDAGNQEETERLLAQETAREDSGTVAYHHQATNKRLQNEWKAKIRLLVGAFGVSALYTLVSYFIPALRDLKIFGPALAAKWLWTLNPSPAYIGQGIIMGPSTSLHMLFGAFLGWGILSPLTKHKGWAPGPVKDWETGSKGWIVWVSLAIMLADSIVNLGWLVLRPIIHHGPHFLRRFQNEAKRNRSWTAMISSSLSSTRQGYSPVNSDNGDTTTDPGRLRKVTEGDDPDDAPPSELISNRTVMILLPLTMALNVACMQFSFGSIITPYLSILATLLALVLSVMGVRALGETDLNPVSGISKLTQLIFAAATPASSHTRRAALVTNLLAGAVSESGALQAGDMMQDLKTGHLLGASPKAQFYGQLIGSLVGAIVSVAVYRLYVTVYQVPGGMFEVPTAYVWIFTARLVTGQGLPEMAWQFSGIAGIIFTLLTILRILGASTGGKGVHSAPWRAWVPGGVAVAVGMYNVPSFALARAIGGLLVLIWRYRAKVNRKGENSSHQYSTLRNHEYDNDDLPEARQERDGDSSENHVSQPEQDDGDGTSSSIVILASGLILGEGIVSIINLALASANVPHL